PKKYNARSAVDWGDIVYDLQSACTKLQSAIVDATFGAKTDKRRAQRTLSSAGHQSFQLHRPVCAFLSRAGDSSAFFCPDRSQRACTDRPFGHSVSGHVHDISANFRLACRSYVTLAHHRPKHNIVERCNGSFGICWHLRLPVCDALASRSRRSGLRSGRADHYFRLVPVGSARAHAVLLLRCPSRWQRIGLCDWWLCYQELGLADSLLCGCATGNSSWLGLFSAT